MDKTKRERSVNFSLSERDILVSLVQKYQNVLENKQSDSTTWKKKEAAWDNIQKEFNARSGGTYRSTKTLKIKYEGLKRTVRKKSAAIRSELYRTGGGKNTAPPLDPVEEHIKEMISLSTDGLESVYDSDVLPQHSQDLSNPIMKVFIEIPSTSTIDTEAEVISQSNQVHQNEVNELDFQIISNREPDALPSTITETLAEESNMLQNSLNDMALQDTPSGKYDTTPTNNKKWDMTSRRYLKSKKHPALIASGPKKPLIDDLTQVKMELVLLQKKILESEITEKKKDWEFRELQRQREREFQEKEHKWKEEEYKLKNFERLQELEFKEKEYRRKEEEHKWKEEEHKLRLENLRK